MSGRPKYTRRDSNQSEIIRAIEEKRGYLVWDLADMGGRILDILVFGDGICLPVEIKSSSGRLTKEQKESIKELEQQGINALVIRSFEDFEDLWPKE